MSSTRTADAGATFRQERYASSAAYEPGLLGNLVARRCKAIWRREDIALVYWLQAVSHREGGLQKFSQDFALAMESRIATRTMVELGIVPGQLLSAGARESLRRDFPHAFREGGNYFDGPSEDIFPWESDALFSVCREQLLCSLPTILSILCLDPDTDLEAKPFSVQLPGAGHGRMDACTWWCCDLVSALHEYRRREIEGARGCIAETTISRSIFDAIDYGHSMKELTVIEGEQRLGKTVSAKAWCAMHPGEAVYVSLESGRDTFTFYRSIARAIGTASSGQMKAVEMRMKLEDMLQERHLTLVIDEAHFLTPLITRPKSAPDRLDWLRTALVDHGVTVILICTPQFYRQCDIFEKSIGWNAGQLKGRVGHRVELPTELPVENLLAIARKMAPHADEASVLRLVGFAQSSENYLAGIRRLVGRATFFANRDGRDLAGRADIKRALDEAAPRLEPVQHVAPAHPRKQRKSAHALPLHDRCKPLSDTLSPALAKRAGMRSPDPEAVNRERFLAALAAAE